MEWRLAGVLWPLWVLCRPVESNSTMLDGSKDQENRTSKLIHSLLNRMDPRVRPNAAGSAVLVTVDSHIMALGSFDEVSMDFKVDIYIRKTWQDSRLLYDLQEYPRPLTLTRGYLHGIWVPDTFFPNEKDVTLYQYATPNDQLKIYHNGTVAHSERKTLKLLCNMDLHYYPVDKQQCYLHLGSFSYEDDQMRLAWHTSEPVTLDDALHFPDMKLAKVLTFKTKGVHKIPGGSFDSLIIEFRIEREYRYFVLQSYFPSMLIVILSWVSFWIDMRAVPARVALSATAVLTMTAHVSGTKPDSPKVSYPKAIDIWSSLCLIFVFLVLIEYACVHALARSKPEAENQKSDTRHGQDDVNSDDIETKTSCLHLARLNKARFLDHTSRLVFPIAFLVINIAYWAYYLNPPPYQDNMELTT